MKRHSFLFLPLVVLWRATAVEAFQQLFSPTPSFLRVDNKNKRCVLSLARSPSRQRVSCSALPMSLFGGGGRQRFKNKNDETGSSTTSSTNASTKKDTTENIQWEVYVDQSKPSLDRGGSATLDAFLGLAPPSTVKVIAAVLPTSSTTSSSASSPSYSKKKKGQPTVRCISTDGLQCFDVINVDSVDKVYRILTKHMQISMRMIPYSSCECLKWKYKGNAHLEAGKFDAAVDSYNEALRIVASMKQQQQRRTDTTNSTTSEATTSSSSDTQQQQTHQQKQQEGILLLMRATAYLQRASSHKTKLKKIVKELMTMVPDASKLKNLYEQTAVQGDAMLPPSVSHSMFRRVLADAAQQEDCFRRTQYWHGLYQYALLQAAQDVLQATQLLPGYSRGWARAGEILSELWKLSESAQYYEKAVQCDPSLQPQLKPVIDRLRKRQELLESARAYGWSEDTLRLALDVAG